MFRYKSFVYYLHILKNSFSIILLFSFIFPQAEVHAAAAGNALYFDGNNDYVFVDETRIVMGGTEWVNTMSFSLWVKPIGEGFCGNYDGGVPNQIDDPAMCPSIFGDRPRWWGLSHGTIDGLDRLWVWNHGVDEPQTMIGIPYTNEEWVHIAWVHSGGMLSAYKNGLLVGSVQSGPTQLPNYDAQPKMQIGAIINNAQRNWSFHGEIDELRIYSLGLSQNDIQSTLFSEISGSEPGLRAYYKMSDGSGTILTDDSVNSFNGTLMDGGGIVPPDGAYPLWITSTAFDKPLARDINQFTMENTPVDITLVGQGLPESTLTYTTSEPLHGSISGTVPNLTYTPNLNYSGSDNFTYQVWDGLNASLLAKVSIIVQSVNDAPVADDQNWQLNENSTYEGILTASDTEDDPLTFAIIDQPSFGNLTGTFPNQTYTPNPNYHGTDSFTFKANDTHSDSNIATIYITINAIPIADDKIINTQLNTPVAVTLTGSDYENSPLSFSVSSDPQHGVLSGTSPNLTYTPTTGYIGQDSFTYTASDSMATSQPATVTISIIDEVTNQSPIAFNDEYIAIKNTPFEMIEPGVLGNDSDPDGDTITAHLVTGLPGLVLYPNGSFTYSPPEDFWGDVSFTYFAQDTGLLQSATVTVTIHVITRVFLPLVAK